MGVKSPHGCAAFVCYQNLACQKCNCLLPLSTACMFQACSCKPRCKPQAGSCHGTSCVLEPETAALGMQGAASALQAGSWTRLGQKRAREGQAIGLARGRAAVCATLAGLRGPAQPQVPVQRRQLLPQLRLRGTHHLHMKL